jgi:hypothetical protein
MVNSPGHKILPRNEKHDRVEVDSKCLVHASHINKTVYMGRSGKLA